MPTDLPTTIQFSQLLDALPDAVVWMRAIYDDNSQIVNFQIDYTNRKSLEMTRGAFAVAVGSMVLSDYENENRTLAEQTFQQMHQMMLTGLPTEYTYFNTHLTKWFLINRTKLGDGILSVARDVSSLKMAEQEVGRQTELLNSVLNSSNSGIMAFEAMRDTAGTITDFTFLSVNEAACQLVGHTAGEMVGTPMLSVFPGNVESGLMAKYVHTTETGEPTQTEIYYNLDGLDYWLDISARKFGDGFVVTFTNVSAFKRAKQQIEQTLDLFQAVIDNSPTALVLYEPVYNPEGDIIDFRYKLANPIAATTTGWAANDLPGKTILAMFPLSVRTGYFDRMLRVAQTGETQQYKYHFLNDTLDFWAEITIVKQGSDVLTVFQYITDLKQLQQQLEASVAELQRSNKNLEQFAYVASHDLQEPLRKIQAFGDMIQARYAPVIGEEGADLIRRMQSAAARMQALIKDVLAYSRVSAKREAYRPVDLNQTIADVLADLETVIRDKQATIRVDSLPTINGDALQLRQLFQNLVSNALKFDKAGRRPEINITSRIVCGRDTGLEMASADINRQFHLIEVADNGIGFDPQYADQIFQVFQRLHSRSDYPGTGIGLAIVRKVVENHQGYSSAEGQPGAGAIFRILLP